MSGVAVTLTIREAQSAAMTGAARYLLARSRGSKGTAQSGWVENIEGACGEMAAAKALGLFWSPSCDTFRRPDIEPQIQVRTRLNPAHDLIVNDHATDGHVYLLVTGQALTFLIVGWIFARDAKQARWWKDYGGHGPAFFVPQGELRSLDELRALLMEAHQSCYYSEMQSGEPSA